MLACIHEHTLTKITNYNILFTTFLELLKSFCTLLSSFWIPFDSRCEHGRDLTTFLFHNVLCTHRKNMSSVHSSNQWLSPNFSCHANQHARLAVQFSTTMQPSNYIDSRKSTATNRSNKASHIFTGNHHCTESFPHSLC